MKLLLKLFVFFAFFLLIRPLFIPGFPQTHDGANHLARLANYALAFKQGQFPPRLAPSFLAGYGYPVFNYNYPLPNILGLPFQFIGVDVETTLKLLLIGALAIGAWHVYAWLSLLYGSEAGLFGVGAYLSAPFLMNNLYVRGVVGEVLAYAIFPCVLYAIERVLRTQNRRTFFRLYLSLTALFLAHNIFAMFLVPAALCYLVVRLWKARPTLWKSLGVFLLAGGSATFFWIPALFEQSFIILSKVHLRDFYSLHFPTLSQLLGTRYQTWGFSYPGPVDTMSFSLGIVFLFSLATSLFVWRKVRIPLTLSLSLILLMLPLSLPIWKTISILQFAQFPWRLLGIFSLAGVGLAAGVFALADQKIKKLLLIVLALTVFAMRNAPISGRFHFTNNYYDSFAETSTVQHEDTPVTLTFQPADIAPAAPMIEGGSVVGIDQWNGSARTYRVSMETEGTVTEPTAFFPGWETTVDGTKIPITYQHAGGRINFSVPAGNHRITTRFGQNTPARLVGNLLSVVSIVLMAIFLKFL